MLNGFVGGIITLERFLSRNDSWTFWGLTALVLGTGCYLLGINGGLILVGFNIVILFVIEALQIGKNPQNAIYQLIGLLSWFVANLKFYFTEFYPSSLLFWELFILLMIVSSRLAKMEKQDGLSMLFTVIIFLSMWAEFHVIGQSIVGIGVIALSIRVGYLEFIRQEKISFAIISAYCWLALSGLSLVLSDLILFSYDLSIHSFFIGFLFTMIFINAPDALLRKLRIDFIKAYPNWWSILLSLGLVIRLIGGDLFQISYARSLGGAINVLIIVGYIFSILFQVLSAYFSRKWN